MSQWNAAPCPGSQNDGKIAAKQEYMLTKLEEKKSRLRWGFRLFLALWHAHGHPHEACASNWDAHSMLSIHVPTFQGRIFSQGALDGGAGAAGPGTPRDGPCAG